MQLRLKYLGYFTATAITFILIRIYWEWFNTLLTNIQLILLNFAAIFPLIFFLYLHKIYKIISIKKLDQFISKYKLLSPKQLEINEKEIILTFDMDRVSKFTFKDIRNIQQINNCLYIIRKDTNNALKFMPIIPINIFENQEAKKEFIELLSKK